FAVFAVLVGAGALLGEGFGPISAAILARETRSATMIGVRNFLGTFASIAVMPAASQLATAQRQNGPSIVTLMTNDGTTSVLIRGGAALGHPTPNIDRIAKEGAPRIRRAVPALCETPTDSGID